jgi:peroxiredoxin Q/BCP
MRATMIRTAVAAGLGVALVTGAAWAAEELKVGDKAPDFELKGSDGKTYKLSDFRGKQPVVLAWFPKAFTGGCTKQCTSYARGNDGLKKLNVAVFTASVDDVDTNTKFAESLGAKYPILSDPSKKVAEAYGVVHEGRAVPERWTFYIDKEGTIRAIDKQIKTEMAAEDTAAKLKELGLAGG